MKKIYLLILFLSCFSVYSQVITYYKDLDLDTYGNPAMSQASSTGQPAGYVLNNTDCNDNDFNVNPGVVDICNGLDDNCNGTVDEGATTTYYRDFDGDSYGMASSGTIVACTAPFGYVANNTDCNDGNSNIHPGATEIIGDGIDQNCDVMEVCYLDFDNDGYRPNSTATVNSSDADCNDAGEAISTDPITDCNDNDFNLNPGVIDVCNGLDDNCNGLVDEGVTITYYRDFDSDGFGASSSGTIEACAPPFGYVANNTDCDDSNPNTNPNGIEISNGTDDNCNGTVDEITTSMIELSATAKIYFYPNPAMDKITVMGITSKTKYQLTNYIGAIVQQDYIDEGNSDISIKSLSSGLYQLKLYIDKTKVIKLIKE